MAGDRGFGVLDSKTVLDEERALFAGKGELAALCLSGGGIRSAAFCLGVIQALASRGLLGKFHYLSTVSGGGYIGGWLTRCIKAWRGNVGRVERYLNEYEKIGVNKAGEETSGGELVRAKDREPRELNTLRRYTNFLTPHAGFASADAWAGLVLWLRNTLINWAVFLPLLLCLAGVPVAYTAAVCWFGGGCADGPLVYWILTGVGLAGLAVANFFICMSLPTHAYRRDAADKTERGGLRGRQIFWRIIFPSLFWTFLIPLALAPKVLQPGPMPAIHDIFWRKPAAAAAASINQTSGSFTINGMGRNSRVLSGEFHSTAVSGQPPPLAAIEQPGQPGIWDRINGPPALYVIPLLNFAVCMGIYLLAWLFSYATKPCGDASDADNWAFFSNILAWIASGVISSTALLAGIVLTQWLHNVLWVSLAMPPLVFGAELLRSAAYVAVRKNGVYGDLDREWLARLSGTKLGIVLGMGAIGTACVFVPRPLIDNLGGTYATIAAFATGPAAALLGKSVMTAFTHGTKTKSKNPLLRPDILAMGLAVVFAITLLALAGRAMIWLAVHVDEDLFSLEAGPVCLTVLLLIGWFGGLGLGINSAVNLNRFSMHAVYRNRLIRAFLGTASSAVDDNVAQPRGHDPCERVPDRYTSFDPMDNMRLADAFPRSSPMLFPVINVAMNRTTGKDTARAQRKAESFTITPLHCGAAALYGRTGAYVATARYAGGDKETGAGDRRNGISLGTAMALSGAAVSPNMGYNSSPFLAFLMTLFNVRLGAWLPNPGTGKARSQRAFERFLNRAGPLRSLMPFLREMTGQSDDSGDYIYLSDGGHFDNLGLYEMLRRRCPLIVAVDAGADRKYAYFDLGHVLEIAAIDLGVQVKFLTKLKPGDKELRQGAAYATIHYPESDGVAAAAGQLIYLKPWLPEDAPIELLAYKRVKKDFPHEPTEDQFFTESDFESYRRLGEFLCNDMLRSVDWRPGAHELADMFRWAARQQAG